MAFTFGWENYATGYSDFEIHRAQQKHYDAFTSVMVETGPGTWTFPSSSGASYSGESTGSAALPVVHGRGKIAAGPAAGVSFGGGVLSQSGIGTWVDHPGLKDPEWVEADHGVYGDPGAEPLTDLTRTNRQLAGPFGPITLYAHPHMSDIEATTEQRVGDGPVSWIYSVWTDLADWAYTGWRAHGEIGALVDNHRAANFWENQRAAEQAFEDFNQQFPLVPEAFR